MAEAYSGDVLPLSQSAGPQPYSGDVVPLSQSPRTPAYGDMNPVVGGAEGAASLLSGAVAGPLAGLAGITAAVSKTLGITDTEAADVVRKVQSAMTYQPTSEMGKNVAGAVAYPFEKLAQGADAAGQATTDASGSPLLGAAVNTAIQALPMVLGKVAPKVKATMVDTAAARAVTEAPLREQVKAATDAGYFLTPNETKAGIVSRSAEGLAGSAKLQKGASAKNQSTTNDLIRKDIGLDENTPAKPEAIQAIIDEAHKPYEAVKAVGEFENDAKYQADLNEIAKARDTAAESYEHRQNLSSDEQRFQDTVNGLKSADKPTTAAAVEEVKLLRNDAAKAFSGGDKALGSQYRALAAAVDNAMDRALTKMSQANGADPALANAVTNYQAARVKIAKAYQAQDALGTDGNFDAHTYANILDKHPGLLSGPALQVANFAKTFPKLAQQAQKVGHYGIDFGDIVLSALSGGGGLLATHAATGGAGAAALIARPVTRAAILSDPVQRAITSPPSSAISQMALDAQAMPAVQIGEMGTEQRKKRRDELLRMLPQ